MQPIVIGIAGGSGSGKTTLARAVARQSLRGASTLPFDNYYRDQSQMSMQEREKVNYDHPNALDIARFIDDLTHLKSGLSLAAPVYDFAEHTRSQDVHLVEPTPLIIVDGILLLVFEEVCELLDLKVFVDVSDALRTERRVARDVAQRGRTREFALEQIERTVRPMYGEFVHPSADRADLTVDGTLDVSASAQLVLGRLDIESHSVPMAASSQ